MEQLATDNTRLKASNLELSQHVQLLRENSAGADAKDILRDMARKLSEAEQRESEQCTRLSELEEAVSTAQGQFDDERNSNMLLQYGAAEHARKLSSLGQAKAELQKSLAAAKQRCHELESLGQGAAASQALDCTQTIHPAAVETAPPLTPRHREASQSHM